jgi:4-amino-4-deoxy-L-arabinose transferase-like glycosyltransferase
VRWGGPGPNYIGIEFQTVSYLAAIGARVFGPAPWVGRVVSRRVRALGIFALWSLVSRVWDRSRALLAAAVMAVLPGAVFIERSLVSDGAMTALMTTSLWMLVAFCQTETSRLPCRRDVCRSLGCLTKLPGGILVIPAAYVVVAGLG